MAALKYLTDLSEIIKGTDPIIFFIQNHYWFEKQGYKPFYKLVGPCLHPFYRKGDSWMEELGFRKGTVKSIKRKIGSSIEPKKQYYLEELNLIVFWKVYPNITYYMPNYVAMSMKGVNLFSEKYFPHFREWETKRQEKGIALSEITFQASQKLILPLSYIQEITTEDKTKNNTKENQRNEFNDSDFFN